jgi:hypothetical protein
MVERLHRQIKEALRARNCGAAWADHVPWVLLGLGAAPKEEAGVSSAEVVFGQQLVLPNQVLEQPTMARTGAGQHSTADAVIRWRGGP